jgi:hypothetical protein
MKMAEYHELQHTSEVGGLLFECMDGCGRRLAVDRVGGRLIVIDRGDPYALHRGSVGGVEIDPPLVVQD